MYIFGDVYQFTPVEVPFLKAEMTITTFMLYIKLCFILGLIPNLNCSHFNFKEL